MEPYVLLRTAEESTCIKRRFTLIIVVCIAMTSAGDAKVVHYKHLFHCNSV